LFLFYQEKRKEEYLTNKKAFSIKTYPELTLIVVGFCQLYLTNHVHKKPGCYYNASVLLKDAADTKLEKS
jgi:hypothetical protein